MHPSKHQTQLMPKPIKAGCWMMLVLLGFFSVFSHAQHQSDWLSHLDPDEAEIHSRAFDDYVADVLANGSIESLKQLCIMASMSQNWAVAAEAGASLRTEHDDYDAASLELAAWMALRDQAKAQEVLEAILAAPAGTWTGWAQLPKLVWSQHEPQQMLNLLDAWAPESLTSDQQMWLLEAKARLAVKLNTPDIAMDLLNELLAKAPTEDRVIWAVRWARSDGRPALALAFLDKWAHTGTLTALAENAVNEKGLVGDLPIWRAELLQELGRSEEAMEVLLEAAPTPEVLFYRARLGLALGQDALAHDAWDALPRTLDQNQATSQEAYYIGHLAQLLGHFGQAWVWFGAVNDPPWVHEALLARGLLLNQLAKAEGTAQWVGSLEGVRAGLERVRQEAGEPFVQQAWAIEALLLRQAEQADVLMTLLVEALAQEPDNHFLLYLRALEAAEVGELELAEQDLRRVIQEDPSHADALNALGYLLADRTTRYREAYQLIHRALQLKPDSPEILDSMGWVNYRLGRRAEALVYLEKAHALNQDPEIEGHLIEVLMADGQKERAEALRSDANKL